MDLQIKNTSLEELTRSVALLMAKEKDVIRELKAIQTMKEIYDTEIESVKHLYHTTKDGVVILLTDMEADHLINTAILIGRGCNLNNKKVKKYVDEIKKRGIVNDFVAKLNAKKLEYQEEKEEEEEFYF